MLRLTKDADGFDYYSNIGPGYRLVSIFKALNEPPFFQESRIPIRIDNSHELEILQIYASVDNEFHLEISSKSPDALGRQLSAFNIFFSLSNGEQVPVECVYQASKVTSNSGEVLGYVLEGVPFAKEYFYDWLYIKALAENNFGKDLLEYKSFSDVFYDAVNTKTENCQAKSCAIQKGLILSDYSLEWLSTLNYDSFLKLIKEGDI